MLVFIPPTALTQRVGPASAQANQFRYVYTSPTSWTAAGSAVTANAFNPGLMPGTGLARANQGPALWAWHHVLPVLRLFPGVHSPAASGRCLAWLVNDLALKGRSGGYYDGDKLTPSSALSPAR